MLGMHRSGTSVITRVVNLLGLRVCREDDLYTAPDNPDGHWESISLVAFNDRLLHLSGGTLSAPPTLPPRWECQPRVMALHREAQRVFQHAHPWSSWVWKDPRTCLTLPFWRRVLPGDPVALFMYREPLEAARSLQQRDGFGKAHGLALWERYARSALQAAAGLPLVVVRFRELTADPVAAVTTLRGQLAALGAEVTGDVAAAAGAVRPGRTASRRPELALAADPDATGAQRALLAAIGALPPAADRFVPPELGAESATTTELLTALRARRPAGPARPAWRAAARGLLGARRRPVRN